MSRRVSRRVAGLMLIFSSPLAVTDLSAQNRTLTGLSDSFSALSELVSPSVVAIHATGYVALGADSPPGAGLLNRREVAGSGVIVDPSGYIVTNAHVVAGAGRVQVRLPIPPSDAPSGRDASILRPKGRIVGAQVVGYDRETDIAVLKVADSGLPALAFGDSDDLRQGQLVFAFGSPLGLENSVTMGVVSGVARQLQPDDPMIYIQTDAPINPGNSGGPLVDPEGRVMGINTFIISQSGGSEGLGFAAPSNIVRTIYEQIKTNGYVSRAVIGVNAQTMTPLLSRGLGLDRDWGVVIGDVYPNGPAAQAGLQIGDQILTLDGRVMENGRQFDVNLYGRLVGQAVTLEILRGDQEFTVRVPVVERPGGFDSLVPRVTPEENLIERLGILGVDLTPATAAMIPNLRGQRGVVVAVRSPDASYGNVALLPGDVIYRANGGEVRTLSELRAAVDVLKPGDALVLQVERRGQLMFLALEISP